MPMGSPKIDAAITSTIVAKNDVTVSSMSVTFFASALRSTPPVPSTARTMATIPALRHLISIVGDDKTKTSDEDWCPATLLVASDGEGKRVSKRDSDKSIYRQIRDKSTIVWQKRASEIVDEIVQVSEQGEGSVKGTYNSRTLL